MTTLGLHTIAEVKDLIKAKDYDVNRVTDLFDAFAPTWQTSDPLAFADYAADYASFIARYQNARTVADYAVSVGGATSDELPAEGVYQGILAALTVTPGQISKGDFQDLYNRLDAANAVSQAAKDSWNTPQPVATDQDLNVYKATDKAIKALPTPKSNPGLYIAGGAVLGIVTIAALKNAL